MSDAIEMQMTFGYGRETLKTAFEAIAPAGNWKLRIDAVIPAADVAVAEAACIFFCGCGFDKTEDAGNGRVRVTAPGYYLTIGA
ncbi:MAG: hypothetical protein HC889_17375 [Synechococcaceae cyanobacterium SM1_2_3]|nr:hypothetical protein [Synechococcaceae cyanobacterium SM1_2_3]